MEKVLGDGCVKLSVVAGDILGVSGRAMLHALIQGERNPEMLAGLAKVRLRLKHDALVKELTRGFDEHHAFLCQIILRRIDEFTVVIEDVTGVSTPTRALSPRRRAPRDVPWVDRDAAAGSSPKSVVT